MDIAEDEPLANTFYAKSCTGRSPDGCYVLAVAYVLGRGGLPKDPDHAAAVFGEACDAGSDKGCRQVQAYEKNGKFIP
jgi:TPR repeat protein